MSCERCEVLMMLVDEDEESQVWECPNCDCRVRFTWYDGEKPGYD